MGYREIEDIGRIAKLGKNLNRALQAHILRRESRKIGYPGGSQNKEVFFLEDNGNDSLWYVNWLAAKGNKMVTLLGHGEFSDNEWLSIDVQFNYPVDKFHRRLGAAFLEDIVTSEVFLAHRGILTLRQRVPKDKVLEAMAADVVEAETSLRIDEYILVTPLDSETLVDDLSKFSRRLRSTVRNLGLESEVTVDTGDEVEEDEELPEDDSTSVQELVTRKGADGLRNYFEEFSGKRRAFTPKKTYPVSYHGKVVHALHEEMTKRGTTLKSRAIDLVADLNEAAILFEVKTKADTQNVYAAVGQLTVHAPTVKRILEKSVRKVLVVPEYPMRFLDSIIQDNLGIQIVTYTISARGHVKLFGLEKI